MRSGRVFVSILLLFLLLGAQAHALSLEPFDPELSYAPKKAESTASYAVDPKDFPLYPPAYEPSDAERKSSDAFLLRVNRACNTVTVYKRGADGQYTEPVRVMLCSVGTGTPTGSFRTSDKYVWHELLGRVYGQYCTRITGRILFHSIPYTRMSHNSMESAEYNKLGTAASMGCVRLACGDAYWVYVNCAAETRVEIYDDSDPGPLGKPDLAKLDLTSPNAGWDPTDPNKDNPWAGTSVNAPKPDGDLPAILGIL